MNPTFIRIGDRLINLSLIAEVYLNAQRNSGEACVRVMIKDYTAVNFMDAEAEALRDYFSRPETVRRLFTTPPSDPLAKEEVAYQDYCDRGGSLHFSSWQSKYRTVEEINRNENPSESQIDRCSRLEAELLY
jgi:hypothetical protein